MNKILVVAGTTEGRWLFEHLAAKGISVDAWVATSYGRALFDQSMDHVFAGRLTADEMVERLKADRYRLVVDATHPYAVEVTENLKQACSVVNIPYQRILRDMDSCGSAIVCSNLEGAIAYFRTHPGRILSTVGSKELPALTQIEDYQKRIVARILPLPEAVQASTQLGFQGKNLICMQGPFSYEMNLATLKDYDCQYLLTKNTGRAGGLLEKLEAAETANAQTVLIDRPKQESGISVKEAFEMICSQMMEDL